MSDRPPANAAPALLQRLTAEVLAGRTAAAARVCRAVDEGWEAAEPLLAALYGRASEVVLVGITGAPGAGKSSLTSRLVERERSAGFRTGVVAVDPSSPLTGGAVLGDRVRMHQHFEDPEVFIRSVATRGNLGGLSATAIDVARVLGAWGARRVFVETVGVGQDELDIIRFADCTLVVEAPGGGDDIQAAKAGLFEVADVFAVNKADQPGADSAAAHLRAMLELGRVTAGSASGSHRPGLGPRGESPTPDRVTEVVLCSARTELGVERVEQAIAGYLLSGTPEDRSRRLERRIRAEIEWRARLALGARWEQPLKQAAGQCGGSGPGPLNPYKEAQGVVRAVLRGFQGVSGKE